MLSFFGFGVWVLGLGVGLGFGFDGSLLIREGRNMVSLFFISFRPEWDVERDGTGRMVTNFWGFLAFFFSTIRITDVE